MTITSSDQVKTEVFRHIHWIRLLRLRRLGRREVIVVDLHLLLLRRSGLHNDFLRALRRVKLTKLLIKQLVSHCCVCLFDEALVDAQHGPVV